MTYKLSENQLSSFSKPQSYLDYVPLIPFDLNTTVHKQYSLMLHVELLSVIAYNALGAHSIKTQLR